MNASLLTISYDVSATIGPVLLSSATTADLAELERACATWISGCFAHQRVLGLPSAGLTLPSVRRLAAQMARGFESLYNCPDGLLDCVHNTLVRNLLKAYCLHGLIPPARYAELARQQSSELIAANCQLN